ncbi:AlpA family phage regulatory protein [Mesorhizobium qingshengii]|uniref:AlpA family phage regulatory protein n=1 Tax=Mesorhizobium qingshengii TaxID=1165689 RepID=A0ABT4R4Q2_9HYPH|nr:AlpA family phage regulatory protein [Mesorhizobium qingshengii]MCZ8548755.1 AlpA family phage regulatory protein [Mesorhizobium qingshengii]
MTHAQMPDTEGSKKTKLKPAHPDAFYLTDRQTGARYGVCRAAIWRWIQNDANFPKPIRLSPGCSRWRLSDLEAWEAAKAACHVAA